MNQITFIDYTNQALNFHIGGPPAQTYEKYPNFGINLPVKHPFPNYRYTTGMNWPLIQVGCISENEFSTCRTCTDGLYRFEAKKLLVHRSTCRVTQQVWELVALTDLDVPHHVVQLLCQISTNPCRIGKTVEKPKQAQPNQVSNLLCHPILQ